MKKSQISFWLLCFSMPWWLFHKSKMTREKGYSLTETLIAVIALGITGAYLFPAFMSNWSLYERRIAETQLWNETAEIIERITADGRRAADTEIQHGEGEQKVVFYDADNQIQAIYGFYADGKIILETAASSAPQILSTHLRFDQSGFIKNSAQSIVVLLSLEQQVFNQWVKVKTETEIYPRN